LLLSFYGLVSAFLFVNQKFYMKVRKIMKESQFKSYDELPLFLNAQHLSSVLGIGRASAYELMDEKGFPTLRVGGRKVVSKEAFIKWVTENTGK
jgi:predicted DNA-binding transcriptional regulator AlpA